MLNSQSPGTTLRLVGRLLDEANGADRVGRMRAGNSVDALDHAGGAEQRVLAQPSLFGVAPVWASSPVPVTSYQRTPCAPCTMPMFWPSAFGRALLDVQLEHRGELCARRPAVSPPKIADALELGAECLAVAVGARIGVVAGGTRRQRRPTRASGGAKRAPSSLVQLTISMGAWVA